MKTYNKPTVLVVAMGDELMQDPVVHSQIGGPQLAPENVNVEPDEDEGIVKKLHKSAWGD